MADMKMEDVFFWSLTPALFDRLARAFRQGEHRKNLRAGLIAAEIRNSNRTKSTDKVWAPSDFFVDDTPAKEQTDEEMLLAMQMWVGITKRLEC